MPDVATRPAHLWVPEYDDTYGDIAAQVGEDLGLTPDPDQREILNAIYAFNRREPDRPVCFDVGVVAPRQNIKTSTFEIAALTDLFVFQEPLHIWTAHLFKTSQETFKHMVTLVEGNREYRRKCRKPRTANGDEAIVLLTGEEIQFHARSKGGGRGLTARKVTLDEALFLRALDMGALAPTLATVAAPQLRYASSGGLVDSAVLRALRDRGRRGGDPSLAYFEWAAEHRECEREHCDHVPGSEGCALDDEELWAQANPALGRRITIESLRNLRTSLPPSEFAREFLTWWEDPAAGVNGIPAEPWKACANREAVPVEPVALAIDVTPGQTAGALLACGGPLHVVRSERGTDWICAELVKRLKSKQVTAVGLDPSGPAGALLEKLTKPVDEGGAGLEVRSKSNPRGMLVLLDGREMAQACEAFLGGVLDGTLVHRDESALNEAAAGAGRRQTGDSWRWSRRDSTVNIAPLVAATVARYLWATAQPETTWGYYSGEDE